MGLDEEIYLAEDYYVQPKESFKFLGNLIAALPGARLLDLGCGGGEFLHFLQLRFPDRWSALFGMDVSERLIEQARMHMPHGRFAVGDIQAFELDEKFELFTAAGVLGYIDEPAMLFNAVGGHAAEGAHLIVFGFMNLEDADVFTEFRYSGHREKANLHSIHTLRRAAARHGFVDCGLSEFSLPFSIARRADNIRRAWTLNTEEGIYFVNGLGQYFRLYAAVFRRSA